MKIAWFSPQRAGEESRSKSAYLSAMLLPYLRRSIEIECFAENPAPDSGCLRADSFSAASAAKFDLLFYQIEDHPACDFAGKLLREHPGVVYYHDVLFRSPFAEGGEHFCRRYAEHTLAALFSNERNLSEFRRQSAAAALNLSSGCCSCLPYPAVSTSAPRREVEAPFLASCGGPQMEYRMAVLFDAVQSFQAGGGRPQQLKVKWLLDEGELTAARRLACRFPAVEVEMVAGRSPERWAELVAGAGAAAHLLYSAFGDPGPYLAISLSCGVPCVVSNFSSTALLPDAIVRKTAVGVSLQSELMSFLEEVFSGSAERSRRPDSNLIREYAVEFHHPAAVAAELAQFLFRAAEQKKPGSRESSPAGGISVVAG